jgi:hypothetical protein
VPAGSKIVISAGMCCSRLSVRAVAIRHQREDGIPNGASREATSTEEVANSIAVLGANGPHRGKARRIFEDFLAGMKPGSKRWLGMFDLP